MSRDNQPWAPVGGARLAWDEHGVPRSGTYDDVYYSREDGIAESRYVFLEGNDLPARFAGSAGEHLCVGETGFGTGLNFLLTWQAWEATPEPRRPLHYLSLEKHPLTRAELERALARWPELATYAGALSSAYPPPVPGTHRLLFAQGRVVLDLYFEEAGAALDDLASRGEPLVDAWYLDGFAPARNASMWQPELLARVGSLSRPRATFSTFTAVGRVRRDLESAGFTVHRRAGFGAKRECLQGQLRESEHTATTPQATPWDLPARRMSRPASALVVGAGLAGCATAAALAARGIPVTLLDQGACAGAASGNDQGVLFTRLSHRHSKLVDFALLSYLHAAARYRALFARGALLAGRDGELCGSFQQVADATELANLAAALRGAGELAEVVDAARAGALTGVAQDLSGIWLPASGWLHPPAVCAALIDHPLVTLREHCGTLDLSRHDGQWRATGASGVVASAPCAVITCGTLSTAFDASAGLPLRSIRGQTSHVPAAALPSGLRSALCHSGYIAPARAQHYCLGATFDVDDPDPAVRRADHELNLEALASALPGWREPLAALDPGALAGRVGFRAATPDYLPLVGPCPDRAAFITHYAALRRDARAVITEPGAYLPGLYINTGHGSRGLSSTPLAGELLASMICAEPLPLDRRLARALAPARFIIRDLSRNRI